MSEITIGQDAPDFTLPTDDQSSVTLGSLKGKSTILYFYPKDDTSGCTAEAIAFSGLSKAFEDADAVVIGVSKDKISSHQKFRLKYDLKITLASDFETQVAENFGVWVEKSMYGRKYMGIERATFLIDPAGKIVHIWRKVKVPGHADDVLRVVQKIV
jgi:thioredoxin-dependent peroxiredoxin